MKKRAVTVAALSLSLLLSGCSSSDSKGNAETVNLLNVSYAHLYGTVELFPMTRHVSFTKI